MLYYLLEVKSNTLTFYLNKKDGDYTFENIITPSSLLQGDSEVISIISIWKNLKHNYFIESYISVLDLTNSTKTQLKENEILSLEKTLISSIFNIQSLSYSFDYLTRTDAYRKLCNVHASEEGNMLQNSVNERTRNAQLSFFKYLFDHMKEENTQGSFFEIGTNKGMFGYIVSQLYGNCKLHTVDMNPESSRAVPILQDLGMEVCFNLGNSLHVLPNYHINDEIALVWVDGGHEYDECLSDLNNVVKYKPKYIAIDDVKFFSGKVNTAFLRFLEEHPEYENFHNPFWEHDDVGIACCRLKD